MTSAPGTQGGPAERPRTQRRLVVLALLALGLGLRVAYGIQLDDGPALRAHCWAPSDMRFFDAWGRDVAAGDWTSARVGHPWLPWHQRLARDWLASRPGEEAALRAAGVADPARAVYERWTGGAVFHQEPLYAYLIGLTYRLLGDDVRWVFAWQLAAGVLLPVLLYAAVRPQLGARVAAGGAFLTALCGPLLAHEAMLLRESLIAFAGVALLWATTRARLRPTGARWLIAGVAAGVALLLKSVYAVYVLGVLAVLLVGLWRRPRVGASRAAAFCAGLALCLAPVVARNRMVGAPPFALSSVGGIVLAMSNAAGFVPGVGFMVPPATAAIMGETDGRMLPAALAALRTHPDAASVARLAWGKVASLWHWYEIPNNTSFYYYRLLAPVLWLAPVGFAVLTPLGLVGLGLGWRARRRAWPLYLLVACHVVSLLVFYTLSRLRVPLVPALAPFAALAVVELGRTLRARQAARVAALGVAVAVLALWAARPLPPGQPEIVAEDYAAAYECHYNPMLARAQEREDWAAAAAVLGESLAAEPPLVRALDARHPPRSAREAELAALFAGVRGAHAELLARAGQSDRAAAERARADELARLGGAAS